MNVFLIGMPGSGKSTAGKKLANKLSLEFIDLDKVIENKYSKKISELFAEEGENNFREKERTALKEILDSKSNYVLSLGGGTPCFFNNLSLINESGITIYLEMPAGALVKRILQGAGERPMFAGLNESQILKKLNTLLGEREQYYNDAKIIVHGTDLDIESLAELVRMQNN